MTVDEKKKVVALGLPGTGKNVDFDEGFRFEVNDKEAIVHFTIDDKQITFGETLEEPAQPVNKIDRITGKATLLGEGPYSCERGTQ